MIFYVTLVLIFALLYLFYYHLTKNSDYWRKRKVAYVKPSLLFGNYKDYILFRKITGKVAQEICQKFPYEPYVGVFYGTDPALVVKDPNLIKLVLAKDFYYFNQREISEHREKELISQNMFFSGGDSWKILRQNSTSLFSSAKMKSMFYLIENCATTLDTVLSRELSKSNVIEMKALFARYTMDCIGSCAFGIDIGALTDETSNPFTLISYKIFDNSNYGGYKLIGRSMWPALFYRLGFNLMEPNVKNFFDKVITEVFQSRNYTESSRNDFIDYLLNWKKKKYITGDSLSNMKTKGNEVVNLDISDALLIGQSVMFFGAGFETTSTTISFLLYELAKHKQAQARLMDEVDDYHKKHNGKIEYESINEMPFLDACVNETLRVYPVLGVITREVSEQYTLPTGLHLEKGTRVHIPVYYLHHNSEYFAQPEEFRPERFLGEELKKITPYTFLPFGEGPRICIGLRFAKMPIAAAILTIFKSYTVDLDEKMPLKLDLEPRAFATQANCDINLKFTPRKSKIC